MTHLDFIGNIRIKNIDAGPVAVRHKTEGLLPRLYLSSQAHYAVSRERLTQDLADGG